MNRTGSCFAMFLQKRFSLVFFSNGWTICQDGLPLHFLPSVIPTSRRFVPRSTMEWSPGKKNTSFPTISATPIIGGFLQIPVSWLMVSVQFLLGIIYDYPLLSMLVHYYPLLSIPNDSIRVCCSEIDFTSHSHVLLGYNFQIHPQVPNAASIRGLCLKMVCIPTNGQLITIFHGRNEVSVASNFGGVKSSFPRDFQVWNRIKSQPNI